MLIKCASMKTVGLSDRAVFTNSTQLPRCEEVGRDDWIRTSDPLTPSQVRYQAAPHPDAGPDGPMSILPRRSG